MGTSVSPWGEVLVFVNNKAKTEDICARLTALGVKAAALHGDMDQAGNADPRCPY